jgi:hypothetical protein
MRWTRAGNLTMEVVMSRMGIATLAGWVALMAGSAGWAYQIDDVRVEWWTGTGPNQALLVVDFWRGNGQADSFAFGCHFSPAEITGLDLLDAVQSANQGFTYAASPEGYLTDFWYVKNGTTYHVGTNWPASWWKYELSSDYGGTWTESFVGAGMRILQDGDTDGWVAVEGEDWTSVPVTPVLGDLNCDGALDFGDINPFVLALSSPAAYAQYYPGCSLYNADINGDGSVNFGDINPFVALFQP